MKLQAEWRDRLRYWTHLLTQDFYREIGDIPFEGAATFDHLTLEGARGLNYSQMPVGTEWGETWQYLWLRGIIKLPKDAEGEMVVLNLDPGGESTLFIDGREFGTRRAEWVNILHHFMQDNILCERGKPGQEYEIYCESYAGHFYPEGALRRIGVGPVLPGTHGDPKEGKLRTRLGRSTFGVWNEDAYRLWLDVVTLSEVCENLSQGSLRAAKIAAALKAFTLAVDFEAPPDERKKSYKAGREILRPALECVNGSTAPTFYGVGNSHLDVVWLWPLAETIRKTARTFAQQLRLLEKYPDYVYLQSQPVTYEMCREHYPALFERVREAIRGGRWVAEGAMWVEPDTNMPSGESLIRQLLYGMRYFKDVLGVDCEILWLPDTFGYTAALPQILRGFSINYLVTQKIFWSYNEGEQFPYHYFSWQGMDGSCVTSYLPTNYTYKTNPGELMPLWENRVQKDEMDKFLLPYGYGDGGGGPTRDYIEFGLRQRDLEGAPRFKMASPNALFRDLERDGGPVHKYTGELYFTAHRGVFTSQAKVKRGNRKCELALREAELWSAICAAQNGRKYPSERLEKLWKDVLLNQFHDILPGSSIGRVYVEAAKLHDAVLEEGESLAAAAVAGILDGSNVGESVSIFNSLSWEREAVVELPEGFEGGAKTADRLPVETCGRLAKVTIPACGFLTLVPAQNPPAGQGVSVGEEHGAFVLENEKIHAVINGRGEVESFTIKASGRQVRPPSGCEMNKFLLFKDVPRAFDAWDIDSPYEFQPVEIDGETTVEIAEKNPLRSSLRVTKNIGNSRLTQTISLEKSSTVLNFDTEIDWRELHRLLKVSFPTDVFALEGINEMQFGYVKRPTHRSRQYDKDRFEVCNHRYTALCDEGRGAAVLNDCKYGVSMHENCINLTLLRAPASPEMRADNGVHHFKYAFTAWDGPFAECDVVRQGYELNTAPRMAAGGGKSASFFALSHKNIVLETVKTAEDDSGDLILRLYESKGASTRRCRVRCQFDFKSVKVCAMDESEIGDAVLTESNEILLNFEPFKVITLKIKTGE